MFGRKRAFFGAMVVAMMLLGGCGSTANNLGGATDGGRTNGGGATSGSGTTDSSGMNGGTENGSTGNQGGLSGGMMNGGDMSGGAAYWDGYGINTGRPLTGSNGERNTYGMRIDGNGVTVGQDLRNAWDDLTGNRVNTNSAVN